MAYIENHELQLYFERAGQGEKLLFIGGVGGDLRSRPNVLDGPLADHFELLAFDQRGTGRSEKPECPYTMSDYVNDTIALMDELEWSNCLIMGVSFGGMVAQEIAIRHPLRVRALVLACTTAGGAGGSSYPLQNLLDLTPEVRAQKLLGIADLRKNEQWQAQHPEKTRQLIDDAINDASPFLKEPGGFDGFRRQIMARSLHNCYDSLHRISTPTLVCAGKYDGQAKLQDVRNLTQQIPNANLCVFEGGHNFLSQDPSAFECIIAYFKQYKMN